METNQFLWTPLTRKIVCLSSQNRGKVNANGNDQGRQTPKKGCLAGWIAINSELGYANKTNTGGTRIVEFHEYLIIMQSLFGPTEHPCLTVFASRLAKPHELYVITSTCQRVER